MRQLNLSRTPEEETEFWISVGSIYLCGSFLFFSLGGAIFQYLKQMQEKALREVESISMPYHLAYFKLYRNLAIFCAVFYMCFAFLLYVIQNVHLRTIIRRCFEILLSVHVPASQEANSAENRENGGQQERNRIAGRVNYGVQNGDVWIPVANPDVAIPAGANPAVGAHYHVSAHGARVGSSD